MSVPANLFIDAPEVQDVSMHQLGNQTETWPEQIIQKVKERIPAATNMSMMTKFMKLDHEYGAATGSVIVNSADKAVVVPVIVKDFMLYPLDLMIAKGKLLPLTDTYFKEVFADNGVFSGVEEYPTYGGLGRFEDANLWNATYPPSLGRYAYASAGYPILDAISDTIDGSELKDFIIKNASAAAGYYKSGHAELIKKVAALRPMSTEKLIPVGLRMLRYEGPNKYSLLSSNDKVFSPSITPMSKEEASNFVATISDKPEDMINDVQECGERVLTSPMPANDVVLAAPKSEVIGPANYFGRYSVKAKSGVIHKGLVIPNMIDFDQQPVAMKAFLGKSMQTVQEDIYGVMEDKSHDFIEGSAPSVGQTGTFVYQTDGSHGLCTIPVTIKTVTVDCHCLKLTAYDLMGRGYKLKINPSLKLSRIARLHNGHYLVPREMKWVVMEGFQEVSNSPEDYAVKTAGKKAVTLVSAGQGRYSVRGVEKYASAMGLDATNLARSDARFILTALGCSQQAFNEAVKTAHVKGHADIYGTRAIPLLSEKVAADRPREAKMKKLASLLKRNLFKEAAFVDSSQTLDAMLSLNFINPDNISKFVGKIPQLKAAISSLASCLLASRLGIREIPEQAASTGMMKILEVVDGLEKLKAASEMAVQ